MTSKATSSPQDLVTMSQDLKDSFLALAMHAGGALACASTDTVRAQLLKHVQALGEACCGLVTASAAARANPTDISIKRDVAQASRDVTAAVNGVLVALKSGSQGTQACLDASSSVEAMVVDLETTAMFAASGAVEAVDNSRFRDHQPKILESARALIDGAKRLVSGAAASQEVLAEAAEKAHQQYSELVERLKAALGSLGGISDAQVLLLNAARGVGSSLMELLGSTRAASGKSAEVHSQAVAGAGNRVWRVCALHTYRGGRGG
jgi:talin